MTRGPGLLLAVYTTLLLLVTHASTTNAFEESWNHTKFTEGLHACRVDLFPEAIENYANGLQNQLTDPEELRKELIAVVPPFDQLITKVCYCIVEKSARPNFKEKDSEANYNACWRKVSSAETPEGLLREFKLTYQ